MKCHGYQNHLYCIECFSSSTCKDVLLVSVVYGPWTKTTGNRKTVSPEGSGSGSASIEVEVISIIEMSVVVSVL